MSITITGGITLSGGGWSVSAPPAGGAGWFSGGAASPSPWQSVVDRITYATDTATASVRGPLNTAVQGLASSGTSTAGYLGGGYNGGYISMVQRVTYATDTATASVRGPIGAYGRYRMAATTDTTTYGWYGGAVYNYGTLVNRITYASDTATGSVRGPLNAISYYNTATGSTSYGWYIGGGQPSPISTIDRIDYANDTVNATTRGPLAGTPGTQRFAGAVTDVTTYGWAAGGITLANPAGITTVQRITYATDTATATIRGPLVNIRYSNSGTNSDGVYGWFGGGGTSSPSPVNLSSITRIAYATDTATSIDRGYLSLDRAVLAGSPGTQ
jgi:hypothetical protein